MKNFENDTSYLRYLNEIFRHCERMFSKAKFWISQQKMKLIKNYGNFCWQTYNCYEKLSNLILGVKIEVCERADFQDLLCINCSWISTQVFMFKAVLNYVIFFVAVHQVLIHTTRRHFSPVERIPLNLASFAKKKCSSAICRCCYDFFPKTFTVFFKAKDKCVILKAKANHGNFHLLCMSAT